MKHFQQSSFLELQIEVEIVGPNWECSSKFNPMNWCDDTLQFNRSIFNIVKLEIVVKFPFSPSIDLFL